MELDRLLVGDEFLDRTRYVLYNTYDNDYRSFVALASQNTETVIG